MEWKIAFFNFLQFWATLGCYCDTTSRGTTEILIVCNSEFHALCPWLITIHKVDRRYVNSSCSKQPIFTFWKSLRYTIFGTLSFVSEEAWSVLVHIFDGGTFQHSPVKKLWPFVLWFLRYAEMNLSKILLVKFENSLLWPWVTKMIITRQRSNRLRSTVRHSSYF